MERIVIAGSRPLKGTVRITGAKNAALPILAATLLTDKPCVIRGLPNLTDIRVMNQILVALGAKTQHEPGTLHIDAGSVSSYEVQEDLMREMRSSIIVMGALLARFGRVKVSQPGGCAIGSRPIDIHLKGLKEMGAEIEERHGFVTAKAPRGLKGTTLHLDYPSVGATENLMMAATLAQGTTIINNAAKEPEIVDLQNFLNAIGAQVKGAGTDIVRIEGVTGLNGADYTVIPDRIVAGTFLLAGAVTRGQVTVEGVIPEHLEALLAKLREMEARIVVTDDSITLQAPERLQGIESLRTLPYPGFPTDLQAPMMTALALAEGTSIVTETIFESRFKHVDELRRMGSNIKVSGRSAIIKGVEGLTGALVQATDLRAGAALVLAGLAAEGVTVIEGVHHIDRGYDRIESSLRELGANIERIGL